MNLQRLTTDLRGAFPEADIVTPVTLLGEGIGSVVVETANGLVFRIARHEEAQRGHQRERHVLPVIQRNKGGLRVPDRAEGKGRRCLKEIGRLGYEKLLGRPLTLGDLDRDNRAHVAAQVAEFLRAMHGVDIDLLREAEIPRFPPTRTRLLAMWQNVSTYLEQHLSRADFLAIHRWHEGMLNDEQRCSYTPTLVHGDCWYENMLIDDERRRLVGIIDFEYVSIGDATIDLATQHYLGDRFAQEVIAAYYPKEVPSHLGARMRDLMAYESSSASNTAS